MRLNIRKGHLAEIYSGLAKLLSHSGHGALIESAPGKVRAVGTNHGETLVYEAESPESETGEGSLALPADQLKEIVSAYGSDTIIAFTEKEEVEIKAEWETKGLSSSLAFRAGGEFPEFKIPGNKSFKPLDRERFRAEYLFCAECTTPERARFVLDSIALDGANSKMLATDGRQLYEAHGVDFPWKDRCYLPTGNCFPEKLLLQSGALEVAKTKNVLAFRNGPWTYLVKLRESNFPPVEELTIDIGDTELLLIVSEADSERLIELLPHLPGKERRSSAVTLKVEDGITLHGESKDVEGEAEGQFALTSSHWLGGPFEVTFSRLYFIRALEHGFRTFRFHPGNAPIVSETETGKYLFMSMTIREDEVQPEEPTEGEGDETAETQETEETQLVPKRTPAETRKRRIDWLKREALWLASRYAQELGAMNAAPDSSRLEVLKTHLQRVTDRLGELREKRKKKDDLALADLVPPTQEMEWEDLGRFERGDGTSVELVRSKEGFFSLRAENGYANVTLEDMAGLFEPLLAGQWKPFTLALYFNACCWWTQAEFVIERTQKVAKRSLTLGVSRPAQKSHLECLLSLHTRLLSEYGESLPKQVVEETSARIRQIEHGLKAKEPETLDLLPLCMALAASA